MRRLILSLFMASLFVLAIGNPALAQPRLGASFVASQSLDNAFGNGQDGDLAVSGTADLNPLRASAAGTGGTTTLGLSGLTGGGFAGGQLVLIHQTSGTNVGTWEFAQVQSADASHLTLQAPLQRTYTTGAQVLWVPQYRDVTVVSTGRVVPSAWNGSTGGIIAFLASGSTTVAGVLDASGGNGNCGTVAVPGGVGGGFRGGEGRWPSVQSFQGEGFTGPGVPSTTNNTIGGGGAIANNSGSNGDGGGGGGHATNGFEGRSSDHGTPGVGGSIGVDTADLTVMHFGGGGGGGSNDNVNGASFTSGAAGGGIIIVYSNSFRVTGAVSANGGQGGHSSGEYDEGGAGAGGAILLKATTLSVGAGLVTATGGVNVNRDGGNGGRAPLAGNGGDGRIRLEYYESLIGSTRPAASSDQIVMPLSITSETSLKPATVGTPYLTTLAATGGTSPYIWSISSGSLSSTLTLDSTAGSISGTPAAAGTLSFTVQVADAVGATATKAFTLPISNPVPSIDSIVPTWKRAGGESLILIVNGGNFVRSSSIYWDTTVLDTAYKSPTLLEATIPKDALSAVRTVSVTVTNPEPAGGVSNVKPFQVIAPPTYNAPSGQSGLEGSPKDFDLGSFLDASSAGPWTVDVHWGDSSSHTSFAIATAGQLGTRAHNYPDNGIYTVTVTLTAVDSTAASGTYQTRVDNVAPSVGPIAGLATPQPVETIINAKADFTDPGVEDIHTATWDWGDGATSPGIVTEKDGIGSVTGSRSYSVPGDYIVRITVTDNDGGSAQSVFDHLIVSKRIASLSYSGPTTGRQNEPIALSAILVDSSHGDITKAAVFFDLKAHVGGAAKSYGPVSPVADGRAVFTISDGLLANVYDVVVRMDPNNGYYEASPSAPATLAIYDPAKGTTTGNGSVMDGGSATDFRFNAKYDSKGVLQGQADYKYLAGGKWFIVKCRDLDWLVMAENTAILRGKASVNSQPNYILEISAADNGSQGAGDSYAIKIWKPDGSLLHELTATRLLGGDVVVPQPVRLNKIALTASAISNGTIDYKVEISLATGGKPVVVEDAFIAGVDYVKGSAILDGMAISDPTQIASDPNRIVYQFNLGALPVGISVLTYKGAVDAEKPCQGQKVSNGVNLFIAGEQQANSTVDTPMICSAPTPPLDGVQPKSTSYWAGNPSAIKPLLPITIYTGLTVSQDWQAVRYLKDASSSDASKALLAQLLAAKLNAKAGADHAAIDAVIAQAEAFLTAHPYGGNPQGTDRTQALGLRDQLATYNK